MTKMIYKVLPFGYTQIKSGTRIEVGDLVQLSAANYRTIEDVSPSYIGGIWNSGLVPFYRLSRTEKGNIVRDDL